VPSRCWLRGNLQWCRTDVPPWKKHGTASAAGDFAPPKNGSAVEAQIAAAVANGAFDNLEGHGKPLEGSSLTGGIEAHIARMLKNHGAGKPKSIQAKDALDALKEKATASIRSSPGGPVSRDAHDEYVMGVMRYNTAVLSDKETFGGAWPLETLPTPRYMDDMQKVQQGEKL